METVERYGRPAHKARWLAPLLLRGEIGSAFMMTEPAVASGAGVSDDFVPAGIAHRPGRT